MLQNLKSVIAVLLLAGFLALVFPISALADNPGDPCTNADPSPAVQLGDGRIIVCNGTVWKSVMDITNNGQSSVQVENDSANPCNADKLGRISYNDGLDTWQYCDGTNWNSFGGASTPTAETIAGGATITANACGSIKRITSASNVTTNTTNTFTASTAAGCCMDVINTGSNTVTLDANAKFKTSADIDQPLGPSGTTRVCSDGTNWYQIYMPDTDPDDIDFTDVTNVVLSTLTSSDIILISGISAPVSVSISGDGSPQFQICNTANCSSVAVAWTSSANTISNGQYLQVRLTSSATSITVSTATVNVGIGAMDWQVTTLPPKYVFITSTATLTGNLGGVSGADGTCQSLANTAGLTGTFKAWIASTAANDPESTFTRATTTNYMLVDGTLVANDWNDLTDGSIDNAINLDESGNTVGSADIWTNVDTNGTVYNTTSSYHCSTWGSTATNGGRTWITTNVNWTRPSGQGGCNTSTHRILCFEQ